MKKTTVSALLLLSFFLLTAEQKNNVLRADSNSISYKGKTSDGKLVFGEEEYVYVKQAEATFTGRIDTGASVSSISAQNIVEFERMGKKFVEFDIISNDRILHVEAPFARNIDIRQSSNEQVQWRISVNLTIKIGEYATEAEFTLVNREKMNYPVLIGRNILKYAAVVDVSESFLQPRADKNGLLIVSRDQFKENKKKNIDVNYNYDIKQAVNTEMTATRSSSLYKAFGSKK